MIAFIGSVFSPWYTWSGRSDPCNHVCINVVTAGPGGRFAMTERGRAALRRSSDTLTIGPSSLRWTGSTLEIDVNEVSAPPGIGRIRGRITLTPRAVTGVELPLTADGAHIWRPFAPITDIRVDLDAAGWQWDGHGYCDANFGIRPLEQDFRFWTWGRFPRQDGAICFYDAIRRDGSALETAVAFDRLGNAAVIDAPPPTRFQASGWRIRRETRADPGVTPAQALNMLDAPFYSRSMVRTRIDGEDVSGVHEALDLDRFSSPLVRAMLAFRMPRRANWQF